MEKLTTKQLTKVANTQQAHIQSLLGLINAYIAYKEDGEGFSEFLKERTKKEEDKND